MLEPVVTILWSEGQGQENYRNSEPKHHGSTEQNLESCISHFKQDSASLYVSINFSEVFLLPAAECIVNATWGLDEVTLHIWPLRQFFIIYDVNDIAGFG